MYFPQTYTSTDLNFSAYFVGSRMTLNIYNTIHNPVNDYNKVIIFTIGDDPGPNNINNKEIKTHRAGI